MIKITKNGETKIVTKGAYENFYKDTGFEIVNDSKPVKEAKIVVDKTTDKAETTLGKSSK